MRFRSKIAAATLCVGLFAAWTLAAAPVTRDTVDISGTVKDTAGTAVEKAIVTSGGGGSARCTTDASGKYSLTVISFGMTRRVTVTATAGTGATRMTGSASDSIPAGSTGKTSLTINITVRGNGTINPPISRDTLTITGTVKDTAGAAVAAAVVTSGAGGFGGGARCTTDASGKYSLTVISSTTTRRVTVTATAGTGATRMTGSASDSIPAGTTGKVALTINITIRSNGTIIPTGGDTVIISGTVKDSTNKAVAGAVVIVGGRGGFGGGGDSAVTDASGAFTLKTVNTRGASTLTVTARIAGAGGGGGFNLGSRGSATVTIAKPADGKTDMVTVTIIIGKFISAILPAVAQKSAVSRVNLQTKVYSVDGRRIMMSSATTRAASVRLIQEGIFQKVLTMR